jgi:hypothetical protein
MHAQGTPAKGREERTLADAPFGARLQGTALQMKMLQFSRKQSLTHARQFKLSPTPRMMKSLAQVGLYCS